MRCHHAMALVPLPLYPARSAALIGPTSRLHQRPDFAPWIAMEQSEGSLFEKDPKTNYELFGLDSTLDSWMHLDDL